MSEKDYISLKQKISVSLPSRHNDWYASSVQDINKKEIYIAIPIKETRTLLLFSNDQVDITFTADQARYLFTTEVIKRIQDNIPMYVLKRPAKYQRIQLREFVRVPLTLPVEYKLLKEHKEDRAVAQASSLDLSAGGMRFFAPDNLLKDDRMILEFTLPIKDAPEYFKIAGVVVRVWDDEERKTHQVAVRFVNVTKKQVDSITGYLFSVMMRDRRLAFQ